MRWIICICSILHLSFSSLVSDAAKTTFSKIPAKRGTQDIVSELSAAVVDSAPVVNTVVLGEKNIPEFKPRLPEDMLPLESESPVRKLMFDGTEYGESEETLGKLPIHYSIVMQNHSGLNESVFQTDSKSLSTDISMKDVRSGLHEGVDYVMTAVESIPTSPVVVQADLWAQEAKAGFMGYADRVSALFSKESSKVGKKLFEAADAYSHRFFNLVHVRESEHPVLAAKVTRIIFATGLSLALVFVIFALALHLQRSLVARAHEQASKQVLPSSRGSDDDVEQLFFAMPYPQLREEPGRVSPPVVTH